MKNNETMKNVTAYDVHGGGPLFSVKDEEVVDLLSEILGEMQIMNIHLFAMTGVRVERPN